VSSCSLRAAQFAAGLVGDLGQVLLQGTECGLQLVRRGRPPQGGRAAHADAALGEQVAQGFQHGDGRLRPTGGTGGFGGDRGRGWRLARRRGACGRGGTRRRIRPQLRQQAVAQQLRIDDVVERPRSHDHRLLEALQQQQRVFWRQVHGGDRGAHRTGESGRCDRQCRTFQRRGADQHGEAVGELGKQQAVVRLAAGGKLVQRGGQLVLAALQQAQWLACGRLVRGFAGFTQSCEAVAQVVGVGLHEGRALQLQQRTAVEAVLLFEMAARAFGLQVQFVVEAVQALLQRWFQPLRAQRADHAEQALCARRPAAACAYASGGGGRVRLQVLGIHDAFPSIPLRRSVGWLPRGRYGSGPFSRGSWRSRR
jgi:hypothetical protein